MKEYRTLSDLIAAIHDQPVAVLLTRDKQAAYLASPENGDLDVSRLVGVYSRKANGSLKKILLGDLLCEQAGHDLVEGKVDETKNPKVYKGRRKLTRFYRVWMVVSEHDRPVTAREIAKATDIRYNPLARLIDAMVYRGELLERPGGYLPGDQPIMFLGQLTAHSRGRESTDERKVRFLSYLKMKGEVRRKQVVQDLGIHDDVAGLMLRQLASDGIIENISEKFYPVWRLRKRENT